MSALLIFLVALAFNPNCNSEGIQEPIQTALNNKEEQLLDQSILSLRTQTTFLSVDTEITSCPAGYFCPSGFDMVLPCPEGTYNPYENKESIFYCLNCPIDKSCPAGSAHPV